MTAESGRLNLDAKDYPMGMMGNGASYQLAVISDQETNAQGEGWRRKAGV